MGDDGLTLGMNRGRDTIGTDTLGAESFCTVCNQVVITAPGGICPNDGSTLPEPQEDALIGQVIDDRFEVLERLGAGGMGVVYRAVQRSVQREVALKVLQQTLVSDVTALKRFFKEARAASSLRHPNTITVFDFGRTPSGLAYIAMEAETRTASSSSPPIGNPCSCAAGS